MSKFANQMLLDRILAGEVRPPKTGEVGYRVKHCPGLYLRLPATGAARASWRVMYRVGGKQVKEVLGTLSKLPRLADAVARAQASQRLARESVNPVQRRREAAVRAAEGTLAAAVDRWFAEHVDRSLRLRTRNGYRRIFEHDVLPRWGSRPLAEITKADVLLLLNDKCSTRACPREGAEGGAVVQANRLLTRLRTFFGWCLAHDLVATDPSGGVRKPARERARDRVLSDDEIRAFWAATEDETSRRANGVNWGAALRLLLLTAQRRSEVLGMRWSEIDFEERVWEIPAARSKNGRPHTVHLSQLAMETLATLPREGDLLFSGNGRTPAVSIVRAKQRLDAAMGSSDWTVHDLRRTATTLMARIGIAPHVADRVLNHQSGTIGGVARIYNRFEYVDERRAAVEALGRFVTGIVGVGEDNVVALRR